MYLAEKNGAVRTHTEFILFLEKGLEVTFGHFVRWKRVTGVIKRCSTSTTRFVVRMNKQITGNPVRAMRCRKP